MKYKFILTEQHGQVEILRLNDPTAMNAINPEMMREMSQEIARIEDDPNVRVVILTGEGRGFCAGANVKSMHARAEGDMSVQVSEAAEPMRQLTPHMVHSRRVVYELLHMTKATIAAINGPCITTGVGLSSACDIRIASDQARIGWIFLRRGLAPEDGSLPLVLKILGHSKAFKLGALGEIISAQQALDIGFLDEIVPHDELLPTCLNLANKIVENVPPLAQRILKRLLTEAETLSYEHSAQMARQANTVLSQQEDHKEALRAFTEKRPPVWTGR